MNDVQTSLVCNICRRSVDGIGFRSTCDHFYCPQCTTSSFQQSSSCPVCNVSLNESDIREIVIGLQSADIKEVLFQSTLQRTSWEDINHNLLHAWSCILEVQRFVNSQLLLQADTSIFHKRQMEADFEAQSNIMEKLNEKLIEVGQQNEALNNSFEQQMHEKNMLISDLQEGYKEKVRKCTAWEKAYNNVRSQIQQPPGGGYANDIQTGSLMLRNNDTLSMRNEEMIHSLTYKPQDHTYHRQTENGSYRKAEVEVVSRHHQPLSNITNDFNRMPTNSNNKFSTATTQFQQIANLSTRAFALNSSIVPSSTMNHAIIPSSSMSHAVIPSSIITNHSNGLKVQRVTQSAGARNNNSSSSSTSSSHVYSKGFNSWTKQLHKMNDHVGTTGRQLQSANPPQAKKSFFEDDGRST